MFNVINFLLFDIFAKDSFTVFWYFLCRDFSFDLFSVLKKHKVLQQGWFGLILNISLLLLTLKSIERFSVSKRDVVFLVQQQWQRERILEPSLSPPWAQGFPNPVLPVCCHFPAVAQLPSWVTPSAAAGELSVKSREKNTTWLSYFPSWKKGGVWKTEKAVIAARLSGFPKDSVRHQLLWESRSWEKFCCKTDLFLITTMKDCDGLC